MLNKVQRFNSWLVLFLLISAFFLYSRNLTGWLIHDDEGGYLYQAWRMTEGEVPYKDFYTPKAPLFLFTGYLIFKLLGPAVLWVRLFSVITTILTGYLIFLIGRRVYNDKIAITGFLSYLILPVVFFQARLYRSDAHAVFFSVLGLFLFIKAWQDKRRLFFVYSGAIYAIAMGYKFSGILGAVSLSAFLLYESLTEKKALVIRQALVLFIAGFLGSCSILLIIFSVISPSFAGSLIFHQLLQPLLSPERILTTFQGNIRDFLMINPRQYGVRNAHPWLIIFSLPLALKYLFVRKEVKKIFSFYLLSISFLLLSPYPGEIFRYLLYFIPVSALVFYDTLDYLFSRRFMLIRICAAAIFAFVALKVFIPALIRDYALSNLKENGTLAFAKYIRKHVAREDYVMADYGDILFHARRRTTPLMSGMSQSAVDNGVISGEKLIKELETYPVKMILIHKKGRIPGSIGFFLGDLFEPHHFKNLIYSWEGSKFLDYIKNNYEFAGNFYRSGQVFDIFMRNAR